MKKLKVGDKVRVRTDLRVDTSYNEAYAAEPMKELRGKKATITGATKYGSISLDIDAGFWNWTEGMLKKVGDNEMTRDDLRDGYVIEVKYEGETRLRAIRHNSKDELVASGKNGYFSINELDESMKHAFVKVTKVYGRACTRDAYKVSTEGRTLLWERKEPEEMTIAEIEEALGHPVKVIGENQ